MTVVLITLGAMIGAPLRYLTDRAVQTRHDSVFPWGTFTVNLAGCLLLGGISGAALSTPWMMLVGTGFCGALTTYSTFSYETVRLAEQRTYLYAALNIVTSLVAGLGATLLAYTAVHALTA
ncbi:fluoride efflux transporter CrcB [Nocardia yunnanensis]|uniref:Fluoride-specific ion channel FluC n=1 Tax=Nocardia yunnanensis TaxID=2382165 RepID=A0A386ZDT8_9NOCA|nr:fluoride efflux transporter CrcB [Nocardia yunnanensis]AYF75537.1 fluoride efflux transporter CrcB [Nocardia yunnanensis]